MPKAKKRGKGNRSDKEKPLLTVQGILHLGVSFTPAQHEDAQTMQIKRSDDAPAEIIRLIPGQSEHDLVQYKAGYDVGPSNPFPQNEPEAEIIRERRKVEARDEAFEEMKRQSERERTEREEKFRRQKTMADDVPPGEEEENVVKTGTLGLVVPASVPPPVAEFNPDDPSNYTMPEHLRNDPAFHNDQPLEFGSKPPTAETTSPTSNEPLAAAAAAAAVAGKDDNNSVTIAGSETQEFPEEMLPKMKPLPEVTLTTSTGAAKSLSEASSLVQDGSSSSISEMALSVAVAMEDKRKQEARERVMQGVEIEGDHDDIIYSLDELTRMNEKSADVAAEMQGPELTEQHIQEVVRSKQQEQQEQQTSENAQMVLAAYWQFVRENPQDFNGWCYLVQHVENIDVLGEVRSAYNAFLALFPNCFAYWQRYSEIEKKHNNWEKSLAILSKGLEAIPLSVDLWISYLELYHNMYEKHLNFPKDFPEQCECAIQTVGLEYRSDPLWERCLDWAQGDKEWLTEIYKRLVGTPTRLYNKHWDNFIAHIRDHHPRDIMKYAEYEELRKVTCQELELTYRPDPAIEPVKPREVIQPEDKLKAGMKERIVASVVVVHERCEEEVDKRYRFEEKIKRTYFHVKPLDLKQLRNWEAYLDFEMQEGCHERIVTLFERCLIPCAHYEQFWVKYARYLEQYHKGQVDIGPQHPSSTSGESSSINKARWAFGTGLGKVDEIREKRCTWTLRGWMEKDKEGKEVMVAEEISAKDLNVVVSEEKDGVANKESDEVSKEEKENGVEDADENRADNDQDANAVALETNVDDALQQEVIDIEMSTGLKTLTNAKGKDSVRDVYRRACIVHCPKKALVKMRWAAFEEESGDVEKAKEILLSLSKQFPLLLECCMQLIDIERRTGNLDKAEEYYRRLMKKVPQNRKNIRAWVAMKFARYQFKVCGEPDKALATLRAALKKERGDPRLYSQIIDVCYQRHPVDVVGVTAAIELAIKSQELTNMQKLDFVKRKVEFMQEFGSVSRCRDAMDQIKAFRHLCAADLKVEARKRKELEREEQKLKELESLKAQVRAEANMKAKIAEAEGRLMCTNCQISLYPDAEGVYEFERSRFGRRAAAGRGGGGTEAAEIEVDEDGVVDLMDLEIPEDQEEQIRKTLEEKTRYKEVAPTWELNMEIYGYGKRRKVYDPDYEHVETAKFKEYERLEGGGYDDELKDPDHDKLRNICAPGLGAQQGGGRRQEPKKIYTTSDYIVPPKVPQLQLGPGIGPIKAKSAPGQEPDLTVFELPPEIANPQQSPCVNVPEWFVKEGGELCLSDTTNGVSVLRYWPKFLSEKGNNLMFNRLRKYCKWHQKQVQIGGEWKYETRLVAWYGPCDYNYSGLNLEKNLNWAPELLDLLHRLIAMTKHDFNSCFLNLYRHGHDMCGWHSDVHPQLGRNPAVASVSLGTVRVFEFRKKNGPPNFIRFPLFPGSLLVMEGATQEDWLHCLPRDVNCKEERINLTFRTMFSIDKR